MQAEKRDQEWCCLLIRMHLMNEENVKAKPKGQSKDRNNNGKLCDCCDHIVEHEDEDAEVANEAKLEEEVQPGSSDDEGSKGPLPALKNFLDQTKSLQKKQPTVPPLHPRVSN